MGPFNVLLDRDLVGVSKEQQKRTARENKILPIIHNLHSQQKLNVISVNLQLNKIGQQGQLGWDGPV